MRKVLIFIKSDGLLNTLKFILKGVVSKLYYRSHTLCLYGERKYIEIKRKSVWDKFQCRFIDAIEEIESLNFDRLKILPCRKWLELGSKLCVVFTDDIPIAFGWIHFREHKIDYVGKFDMGNETAWLGPYFVHRKYRGNGLQQLIIKQGIEIAPININAFITSVNASNIPSLNSFEKNGFKLGMKVSCKTGVFAISKCANIDMADECSKKYLKIKR